LAGSAREPKEIQIFSCASTLEIKKLKKKEIKKRREKKVRVICD
jgi:hypothetical protein